MMNDTKVEIYLDVINPYLADGLCSWCFNTFSKPLLVAYCVCFLCYQVDLGSSQYMSCDSVVNQPVPKDDRGFRTLLDEQCGDDVSNIKPMIVDWWFHMMIFLSTHMCTFIVLRCWRGNWNHRLHRTRPPKGQGGPSRILEMPPSIHQSSFI